MNALIFIQVFFKLSDPKSDPVKWALSSYTLLRDDTTDHLALKATVNIHLVFVSIVKIAMFHGLFSWFTLTLLGLDAPTAVGLISALVGLLSDGMVILVLIPATLQIYLTAEGENLWELPSPLRYPFIEFVVVLIIPFILPWFVRTYYAHAESIWKYLQKECKKTKGSRGGKKKEQHRKDKTPRIKIKRTFAWAALYAIISLLLAYVACRTPLNCFLAIQLWRCWALGMSEMVYGSHIENLSPSLVAWSVYGGLFLHGFGGLIIGPIIATLPATAKDLFAVYKNGQTKEAMETDGDEDAEAEQSGRSPVAMGGRNDMRDRKGEKGRKGRAVFSRRETSPLHMLRTGST